jgi:hypothetical protein
VGLLKLIFYSLAAAYHQGHVEKAESDLRALRDSLVIRPTNVALLDRIPALEKNREKHKDKKEKLDRKIERLKAN